LGFIGQVFLGGFFIANPDLYRKLLCENNVTESFLFVPDFQVTFGRKILLSELCGNTDLIECTGEGRRRSRVAGGITTAPHPASYPADPPHLSSMMEPPV
jgi:hypothetical protein